MKFLVETSYVRELELVDEKSFLIKYTNGKIDAITGNLSDKLNALTAQGLFFKKSVISSIKHYLYLKKVQTLPVLKEDAYDCDIKDVCAKLDKDLLSSMLQQILEQEAIREVIAEDDLNKLARLCKSSPLEVSKQITSQLDNESFFTLLEPDYYHLFPNTRCERRVFNGVVYFSNNAEVCTLLEATVTKLSQHDDGMMKSFIEALKYATQSGKLALCVLDDKKNPKIRRLLLSRIIIIYSKLSFIPKMKKCCRQCYLKNLIII